MAFLLAVSSMTQARETINLLWAFSPGSSTAANARLLVEEANKIQNKYLFVFTSKPGAGGSIAANTVASNPDNHIVSMSSSFIIRPNFEKADMTHNLNDFVPVLVQANGAPLFVLSSKHSNLKSLLAQPNLTIGVSGVGSISHLVATEIIAGRPSATIVNFKSMPDASLAAAGGHVDAAVGVISDVTGLIESKKLTVLGYTGQAELPAYNRLLLSQQGLPATANLTANYAVYVSTNMNPSRFKEIKDILMQANKTPAMIKAYKSTNLIPAALDQTESEVWYAVQRRFWQRQVEKIAPLK